VWGELQAGFGALRRDPPTWAIFVVVAAGNLGFVGATLVGIPVLAKLELAAGDPGVGALFGAFGAGALAGAVVVGVVPAVPRPGAVLCLGVTGCGLALAGAAAAPTLWAAAAWLALAGALDGICPVIGWTLVQTRTPAPVRGRAVALVTLGLVGLQPLSLALAGVAGEALGARTLLAAGGAVVGLAGLYGLSRRALREVTWA
jgi:hypothetical protein